MTIKSFRHDIPFAGLLTLLRIRASCCSASIRGVGDGHNSFPSSNISRKFQQCPDVPGRCFRTAASWIFILVSLTQLASRLNAVHGFLWKY